MEHDGTFEENGAWYFYDPQYRCMPPYGPYTSKSEALKASADFDAGLAAEYADEPV